MLLDVGCVGWEVDGVEGFGATVADGGVFCLLAYVGDVTPAALTFGLQGFLWVTIGKVCIALGQAVNSIRCYS